MAKNEDADLAEVASQLVQRQTSLEASYTLFGRLAKLGPGTITSMDDLLDELDRVRRLGYATTWEELEAGLCSTAAPVRGSRGTVIAAISVSAPTVRTSRDRLAELSVRVVDEADALTDTICRSDRGEREG